MLAARGRIADRRFARLLLHEERAAHTGSVDTVAGRIEVEPPHPGAVELDLSGEERGDGALVPGKLPLDTEAGLPTHRYRRRSWLPGRSRISILMLLGDIEGSCGEGEFALDRGSAVVLRIGPKQ